MNFRKKKIGIVISCRLKSSRLPNKAILKIGKITSIERCINQVKKSNIKNIVLATSLSDRSSILKKIAKKKYIGFFQGSDNNLILRNLEVADKMNYNHIVRVTGDSPLVSYKLINDMAMYHLKENSDFTYNDNLPLGVRCEIINVKALRNLYEKTFTNRYGEYLSLFFKNNPNYFNIKKFNLLFSKKFKNIRLNLDYKSDLIFLRKLLFFYNNKKIISLEEIYEFLEIYHKQNVFIKSKYNKHGIKIYSSISKYNGTFFLYELSKLFC